MSTPIVEQIAVKLVALVNGITTANGYNYTLSAVRPKRIHLEGDINTDRAVIIEQENAGILQDTNTSIVWRQGFTLQALVIDSDEATDPIDTRLNKIRSDMATLSSFDLESRHRMSHTSWSPSLIARRNRASIDSSGSGLACLAIAGSLGDL